MNLSLFMTGMPVFLSWQLYDITFLVGRVYHQDNQSWKMCKGKGVKEEKCDFIVGMAKAGATISKIVDETERPKSIVTTILRKYRLRVNVFQTKVVVDLQIQRKRQSLIISGCMFYDGVCPLAIVNGKVPSYFAETFLTTSCRKATQGKTTILHDDNASVRRASVVTSSKKNVA